MVPWAHPNPQPKQHIDRFSRFTGLTPVTDRPTYRPTDHVTRSVTIAASTYSVRSTAMRPNTSKFHDTFLHLLNYFDYKLTEHFAMNYFFQFNIGVQVVCGRCLVMNIQQSVNTVLIL